MPRLKTYETQVSPNRPMPQAEDMGMAEAQAGLNMGQALSQTGSILQDIQLKQQDRFERLSRVSASERARQSIMMEMDRMRVESDITDPQTRVDFDQRAQAIIEQEMEKHSGRPDSKTSLRQELIGMKSQFSVQFMKEQSSAQLQQASNQIQRKSGELINLVADRPDALGDSLDEMDKYVDDALGMDVPGPELEMAKTNYRSQLVSSAFYSMNEMAPSQSKLEAMNKIINSDVAKKVDNDTYRKMKIDWYKAQAEYDRSLVPAQTSDKSLFEYDRGIVFLHNHADAYAKGELPPFLERTFEDVGQTVYSYSERIDPFTKSVMVVRERTPTQTILDAFNARGRGDLIDRRQAPVIDPQGRTGIEKLPIQRGKSLYDQAIEQTGPGAAVRRAIKGNVFTSDFAPNEWSKDIGAKQDLISLQKGLVTAMQKNKNYAVYEMQRIMELFNIEPKVFESKSAMKEKLDSIDSQAMIAQAKAFDDMNNPELPADIKVAATQAYKDLIAFRSSLQAPTSKEIMPGSTEEKYQMTKQKQQQSSGGSFQLRPQVEELLRRDGYR